MGCVVIALHRLSASNIVVPQPILTVTFTFEKVQDRAVVDDVGAMVHLRDLQSVSKAGAKENERRHE